MAKRESHVVYGLNHRETRLAYNGALVNETVDREPYVDYRYFDSATHKRVKPAVPELYPTSMKKFGWITFRGQCRTSTIDKAYRYDSSAKGFSYASSTSWNALPGVSTYGNGVPIATRNLELEWECAMKLRKKILNSSLALSVTMAEAKTTVSWIAQRGSDIALSLKAIKNADWGSLRKTVSNISSEYKKLNRGRNPREVQIHSNGRLYFKPKFKPVGLPESPPKGWSTKTAAARWLEVRYAITPLLSDVDGIAKNLAEFLYENRFEYLHKWATAVDVPPDEGAHLVCRGDRASAGSMNVRFTWKSARVFKYSVHYAYSKWLAAFQKLQLGNGKLVAWEMTPYSFVFDWLVDVGSYLELANATVGCEFLSGTKSYRVAGEPQSLPVVFEPGSKLTEISVDVAPGTFYKIYEREVIGSFPNFLPTVRSPLSTAHVIDALALIRVTKP